MWRPTQSNCTSSGDHQVEIDTLIANTLIMAALRGRCGYYIFILWFLLSFSFFFSSPILSRRRLDLYHTSTHDVALVRISNAGLNVLHAAR